MLEGFENHTRPLSEFDRTTLVPQIMGILRFRKGENNAIKAGGIIDQLRAAERNSGNNRYIKVTEIRVRRVLSYIRMQNKMPGLIATSKGYFIASSLSEMKKYIDSLNGRIAAIAELRDVAVEQYLKSGGEIEYKQKK